MQDVEDLLEPLQLLAHTSKVEIGLTEGGGVARRTSGFSKAGIMGQLQRNAAAAALAKAKIDKVGNQVKSGRNPRTQKSKVSTPSRQGSRASIRAYAL